MLKLRLYGDPILRRKTRAITEVTDEVRKLSAEMTEAMHAARGIGLAANQVGVSLKMLVMDLSANDEEDGITTLLNPRIVARSGSYVDEEGCLSFPGLRIPIKRAMEVRVEALDMAGNPTTIDARGLTARVLQHEIDHLDNILFTDRLPLLKRIRMFFRLMKLKRRYRGMEARLAEGGE